MLEHFDLSLAKRRATKNAIVYDAALAMKRAKLGDAYGAQEWREGTGAAEVAFRTERIERGVCRVVAEYAGNGTGGTATSDLGGHASTTEFTDAVVAKIKSKLDVWAAL